METRRIGDVEVSVVGLGCNQFGRKLDLQATRAVIDAAIDAGITHFDTADIYGGQGRSEELMGQVLSGRRDQVVIASKFGMDMGDGETRRGRAEYIRKSIDGSLRRLRTDHLDVYWLHEPDPDTPIEETLGALDELVQAGKVRAIGCSQTSAAQIESFDHAARRNESTSSAREGALTPFAALQDEYSLLARELEAEAIPACERHGLVVIPFFPLARGLLTGKYRRGEAAPPDSRLAGKESPATDEQFDVIDKLAGFAAERGLSMTDVAIGWLAAQPLVASVIAGATKPEQVRANVAAGEWKPSAEDLAVLDAITRAK